MTDSARMTDAIWHGDTAAVAALIRSGADVNVVDGPHWPPLQQAIEHQRVEIIRLLIAAGAAVNREVGDRRDTPLAHAIDIECDAASQAGVPPEAVSTELVELLLSAGARPTGRAFEVAAVYRNHKVQSLLEGARHAEPGAAPDRRGITAFRDV